MRAIGNRKRKSTVKWTLKNSASLCKSTANKNIATAKHTATVADGIQPLDGGLLRLSCSSETEIQTPKTLSSYPALCFGCLQLALTVSTLLASLGNFSRLEFLGSNFQLEPSG